MATLLGIDTSSPATSICLSRDGTFIAEARSADEDSHTESLAAHVATLFAECSVKAEHLSAVIIGEGPGSFTGLRIAFAFAKGLALALEIPLLRESSLAAAAREFSSEHEILVVMRDARREEIFVQAFESMSGRALQPLDGTSIIPVSQIDEYCQRVRDLAGSPAKTPQLVADHASFPEHRPLYPRHEARGLVQVWQDRNAAVPAYSLSEIIRAEPLYVRSVSAKTIAERAMTGR